MIAQRICDGLADGFRAAARGLHPTAGPASGPSSHLVSDAAACADGRASRKGALARKTSSRKGLARQARAFAHDQRGAASVWAIFWTTMLLIMSGFVLDVANAYRIRALLQATADASALAAARELPNPGQARKAARDLAALNMPEEEHGDVMPNRMIALGAWDETSGRFIEGQQPYDAVQTTAARGAGAGRDLPTFLIGLVGTDAWKIAASSTARARSGGGGASRNLCPSSMLITEANISMAGTTRVNDGVCLHADTQIHFGGNNETEEGARYSVSPSGTFGNKPGITGVEGQSIDPDSVTFKQNLSPVILPQRQAIFDNLWNTLYHSGIGEYSGPLLPDNLHDPVTGTARVVRVNQWWWTVQPGDLQPYTIYMVNHGVQLAGNVDAQNVAIIANGQLQVGGGSNMHFDSIYFFGRDSLQLASGRYGYTSDWCQSGEFDVYMKTLGSLQIYGDYQLYSTLIMAPTIGGAGGWSAAGGVYIETKNSVTLGGSYNIDSCPNDREGIYEIVVQEEAAQAVLGGLLVR